MSSLIEVKNLSFTYRSKDRAPVSIFKDFNLSIEEGDWVSIMGPSGTGKSTLLYLLSGLLKVTSGDVTICHHTFTKLNDEQVSHLRNKNIGLVFQQFYLLPKLTILENILLPIQYDPSANIEEKKEKAHYWAQKMNILSLLDSYPRELSGGQQQRVSIARSLIMDANIILADEPTGSLDEESAHQIIAIFRLLNEMGKTIVVITHDQQVAENARRVISLKNGTIEKEKENRPLGKRAKSNIQEVFSLAEETPHLIKDSLLLAFNNLRSNKLRSFLNTIGIIVGVAAVSSMLTIGSFVKDKILDSFQSLGAGNILVYGHPNFDEKAEDRNKLKFLSFDEESDLATVKRVFKEIKLITPNVNAYRVTAAHGGLQVDDVVLKGTNVQGQFLSPSILQRGVHLSPAHLKNQSAVCIIGANIAKKLFKQTDPLHKVINITQNQTIFTCLVVGVNKSKSSNSNWDQPDNRIILPYNFLMKAVGEQWYSLIHSFTVQVDGSADPIKVSKSLENFFRLKYGSSGNFRSTTDSVLLDKINSFLTLFNFMLIAMAMISLGIGGIGITNMMLISISERLKEIGLSKAVGATNKAMRYQMLAESLLLCTFSGFIGIFISFVFYETALYVATNFVPDLSFSWFINWPAMLVSLTSILLVGLLSGLIPALKAEKLQVIEALRNE